MKRGLSAALLLIVSMVTAHLEADGCAQGSCSTCCQPCFDLCNLLCGGKYEVWGEALYMRPSLCDLNYAIKDERSLEEIKKCKKMKGILPVGKQLAVRHDYEWGWRLGAGYLFTCACVDLRIQYTNLHSRRKVASRPEVFWITFGTPGTPGVANKPIFSGTPTEVTSNTRPAISQFESGVTALSDLDYDAIDLELGKRKVTHCCCLWYRIWVALHYAHIENCFAATFKGTRFEGKGEHCKEKTLTFQDVQLAATDFRRVWGAGPRIGIEGRYQIFCGFGIGGRFSLAVLAGNSRGRFTQQQQILNVINGEVRSNRTSDLDVTYHNRCVTFPVVNGRLGVNYSRCIGCIRFLGEFGYEMFSYINAVARPTFNDIKSTESTNCQSYNAHGFYLNLGVQI